MLQNGVSEFSTKPYVKFENSASYFKKKKGKQKPNFSEGSAHAELTRTLDAIFHSLSQNQVEKQGKIDNRKFSTTSFTSEGTSGDINHDTDDLTLFESHSSSGTKEYSDLDHSSSRNFQKCSRTIKKSNKSYVIDKTSGSKDKEKSAVIDKTHKINNSTEAQNKVGFDKKIVTSEQYAKNKHKEKKINAAVKEFYQRKSIAIENERTAIKNGSKFTELVHKHSSFKAQAIVGGSHSLSDACKLSTVKEIFKYRPCSVQDNNDVGAVKVKRDLFEVMSVHQDKEYVDEELGTTENQMLPDKQWQLIKLIRKYIIPDYVRSKMMSQENVKRIEQTKNPFPEVELKFNEIDSKLLEEALENAKVPDTLEGILTQKAHKSLERMHKSQLECTDLDTLKQFQLEMFNARLKAYVDACVSTGMTMKALEDVRFYRRLGKLEITDIEIYNILLRGLVKMDSGIDLLREVFSFLKEDGIEPTMTTYSICLSGIHDCPGYEAMLGHFIIKDMKEKGMDVHDIFNQCTFLHNERHKVFEVLNAAIPDFKPNPPRIAWSYTAPLVEPLNHPLPHAEKVELNPMAGTLSKDEIMMKAEEQFSRELDVFVSVQSVFHTKFVMDKIRNNAIQEMKECWRVKLKDAFLQKKADWKKKAFTKDGISMYPFFCLFPEEDYINILCKQVEELALISERYSPQVNILYSQLVDRIHKRYIIQKMIENDVFPKLHKIYSEYVGLLSNIDVPLDNHRLAWQRISQKFTDGNSMDLPTVLWSSCIKKEFGQEMLDIVLNSAVVNVNWHHPNREKKYVICFSLVNRNRLSKTYVEIKPHMKLSKLMNGQADLMFPTDELPSLCPPLPYISTKGGNFINNVNVIRYCAEQQQTKLKQEIDGVGAVLDSLNILGACGWRINNPMLDVILTVFKNGGDGSLDIPLFPENIEKPLKAPGQLSKEEFKKYTVDYEVYLKTFAETNSLWWSALYKLSIANKMRNEVFWYPLNLDFRGRTYPVPPHLNHQGQDFVRCLLVFAKGKPLGPKGLDWLKLHLVNLTGHKKKSSNADKLAYANEILPHILDSADNPLAGGKWWMTCDEPWQTLSACMEIANATRSDNPEKFVSHFVVHQDGSCNGLQHFAALGRDDKGAKSVNLYPFDVPSDVYQQVVDLVKQEIERDIASNGADAQIAKLCQPYLERKVIKQSIMTTVYGVTAYGANIQIKKRLEEKNINEECKSEASKYLTKKTFHCLKLMFLSAKTIQNWLESCAHVISHHTSQPVEWKTPLGFPVIQPYFRNASVNDSLIIGRDTNPYKQKNGISPNFIHSLDSCHMMLTALYCHRKGLTFMSVHDCFWTHACDVEHMNKILREQFVALHSEAILEELSQYFVKRFCVRENLGENVTEEQYDRLCQTLSTVPTRGDFDLDNVLKSTYFFS